MSVAAEALLPGVIIMGMWWSVVGLTHLHDFLRVRFGDSVHRKVNRDLFQSYMDCRDVSIKKRLNGRYPTINRSTSD